MIVDAVGRAEHHRATCHNHGRPSQLVVPTAAVEVESAIAGTSLEWLVEHGSNSTARGSGLHNSKSSRQPCLGGKKGKAEEMKKWGGGS